jgi:dTDP-4-dehydrorhamnose reductase
MYSFINNLPFRVANDVIISPTYVPDLVHTSLDLMMDDESGIWNISNKGDLSWEMLAREVAQKARCSSRSLYSMPLQEMGLIAPRPHYSVLKSEKCFQLPSLDNSLERFFSEQELMSF